MRLAVAVAVVSAVFSCAPCPAPTPTGCPTEGAGTINVTSTGLPAGVPARIQFLGRTTELVTGSLALTVGAGPWLVQTERVTVADPIVRTVYRGVLSTDSFCLASGGTQDVTVTWTAIPTSNALWVLNQNATGQLLGFRSPKLRATATVAADVVTRGPLGKDLAFDLGGNLWTLGPTTVDATIVRFAAADFAASELRRPDREFNLAGAACLPLARGLAFDPSGNLYVGSPCRDAVYRLDAAQLAASAELTPALTIPVADPIGLAFDRGGNLWVASASDGRIWRYDASQLAAGGSVAMPALKLGGRATDVVGNPALLSANWLAFDARGDLWANDFAANVFFRLAAADLRGAGTQDLNPQVRLTIGVTAILEGFAFDEEGGLWSGGVQGTVIRLAPAQLDVSSGSGAPTVPALTLTSGELGSANNLAFYPAPAGTPLFHRLP